MFQLTHIFDGFSTQEKVMALVESYNRNLISLPVGTQAIQIPIDLSDGLISADVHGTAHIQQKRDLCRTAFGIFSLAFVAKHFSFSLDSGGPRCRDGTNHNATRPDPLAIPDSTFDLSGAAKSKLSIYK